MFDNVLHQSATSLLSDDIARKSLPGSILFSGPASSGKLTCALELARVLSCTGEERGAWTCTCPSCLKHKALVSQSVLLVGPSNRTLELQAAKDTLLSQFANDGKHLEASRYLYVRAVRKLTMRFNPVLWQGESKLAKFAPLVQSIDDCLELIEPGKALPSADDLDKLLADIEKNAIKLESDMLYRSLPVAQIRAASMWAHLSSTSGKKVLIIESADLMESSAKNALLKILEEPPEDCQFILTTAHRSSLLPTILSRVRTYSFFEREDAFQKEVIERVFHYKPFAGESYPVSIDSFLQAYLPVPPNDVKAQASRYFKTIAEGHVPDIYALSSACNSFSPRELFRIFLTGIIDAQKSLSKTPQGSECSAKLLEEIDATRNSVFVFNQTPISALEELARNIMQINFVSGGVLKEAL